MRRGRARRAHSLRCAEAGALASGAAPDGGARLRSAVEDRCQLDRLPQRDELRARQVPRSGIHSPSRHPLRGTPTDERAWTPNSQLLPSFHLSIRAHTPPFEGSWTSCASAPGRRGSSAARQPAVAIGRRHGLRETGVGGSDVGRLLLRRPAPCRRAPRRPCSRPTRGPPCSRAPTPSTTQGPSPAPTIMWLVPAGQWTKSLWPQRPLLALDDEQRLAARTRKSSWSASQWYIPIGSPGPRTKRAIPTWGNSVSPSNGSECPRPAMAPARLARVEHEPALAAGTRPRSVSSSAASGTTVRS